MRRCLFAGLAILMLVGGCAEGAGEITTMPDPETTTLPDSQATTTPVPATTTMSSPTVVGALALGFSPWQEGALVPPAPRSVSFLLLSEGGEISKELRDPRNAPITVVDDEVVTGELSEQPNWEFAVLYIEFEIALDPGDYELLAVEVNDPRWWSGTVSMLTGRPRLTVSDSGCTYVGTLNFNYYRLPPGSLADQENMAADVARSTGIEYFTLVESGGFFGDSTYLDVPPTEERPESAAGCIVLAPEWQS